MADINIERKSRIIFGMMLILLSSSLVIALDIRQIYTIETIDRGLFVQAFLITDSEGNQKTSFKVGEIVTIAEGQLVDENCNLLTVALRLKRGSQTVNTFDKGFGQAGYQTAFYEITQDTSALSTGTYTIETQFFCDGQKLNQAGRIDSSADPNIATFKVISTTSPPPAPSCSKVCNTGQKLIDSNSASCFCENQWTAGDGKCDLGEISADCDEQRICQAIQIKISGLCIDPSRICVEDGGTKDCSFQDDIELLNLGLYILSIVLIISGGFITFKN